MGRADCTIETDEERIRFLPLLAGSPWAAGVLPGYRYTGRGFLAPCGRAVATAEARELACAHIEATLGFTPTAHELRFLVAKVVAPACRPSSVQAWLAQHLRPAPGELADGELLWAKYRRWKHRTPMPMRRLMEAVQAAGYEVVDDVIADAVVTKKE